MQIQINKLKVTRSKMKKKTNIRIAENVYNYYKGKKVDICSLYDHTMIPTNSKEWFKKPTRNKSNLIKEKICFTVFHENKENIENNIIKADPENLMDNDNEFQFQKINNLIANKNLKHRFKKNNDMDETIETNYKVNKITKSYTKRNNKSSSYLLSKTNENITNDYEIIKMEGFLEEYNNGLLGSWKERYCMLKGRSFKYYENKESKKIKYCINFDIMKCILMLERAKSPTKFEYLFLLIDRLRMPSIGKNLIFRNNNSSTIKDWIAKIRHEISISTVTINDSANLASRCHKFWEVILYRNNSTIL